MSIIRKPRIEQMSLAEFAWMRRHGYAVNLKTIGYTETDTVRQRTKKIRVVAPGTMPQTWPKLAAGSDTGRNPSQPPPKYKAGFSEKYLAKEFK